MKIDKERTWVFAPTANIVIKTTIYGDMTETYFLEMLKRTIDSYEMLKQKVVLDEQGNSFYKSLTKSSCKILPLEKDWETLANMEEKAYLAIEEGEMMRFFYQMSEHGVELLIVAHHIACDGLSLAYFIQELMNALDYKNPKNKPMELMSLSDFAKESAIKFPISILLKYTNQKWRKSGKKFFLKDRLRLHQTYWSNHDSCMFYYVIEGENYHQLLQVAKVHKVTINTVITTALLHAFNEESKVGMAVSLRKDGCTSMANMASGISTEYRYDMNLSFFENAVNVQKLIYEKLNSSSKRLFLLQFMGHTEPTLIDAIYFAALDNYEDKMAQIFSRMFGYSGNPNGISLTNLTRVPIRNTQNYRCTEFIFVPPLVLNGKRVVGVASLENSMTITLHIARDGAQNINQERMEQVIKELSSLKQ